LKQSFEVEVRQSKTIDSGIMQQYSPLTHLEKIAVVWPIAVHSEV